VSALVARAWALRCEAREAIRRGDARRALERARAAEELASTPRGRRLVLVARWLAGG
jgi:hypothetical protein